MRCQDGGRAVKMEEDADTFFILMILGGGET